MFDEENNNYPAPDDTPDEYNPHSPQFYQNVPGREGDYVNDAFSRGYTDEHGNESGDFSSNDGFKGFQGYYDNSGFEHYEGYKGPDPYYRGYHGNAGYNPTAMNSMPVSAPSPDRFVPNYEQLKKNAKDFYYHGYDDPADTQSSTPAPLIKKEDYDMSFAHFSSISHIWSAASLILMFIASSITSYILTPVFAATKMNLPGYFFVFTPLVLFIISGAAVYKIANKSGTTTVTFILLFYGIVAGIAVTPVITLFFGQASIIMSFAYLVLAAVLAVLSVLGFISNKNTTSMFMVILGGAAGIITFFVICHHLGITGGERTFASILCAILVGYAAVESFAVKRTYEEFITDDKTLYKNAVISAIGHYVSFATLFIRFFSTSAELGSSDMDSFTMKK